MGFWAALTDLLLLISLQTTPRTRWCIQAKMLQSRWRHRWEHHHIVRIPCRYVILETFTEACHHCLYCFCGRISRQITVRNKNIYRTRLFRCFYVYIHVCTHVHVYMSVFHACTYMKTGSACTRISCKIIADWAPSDMIIHYTCVCAYIQISWNLPDSNLFCRPRPYRHSTIPSCSQFSSVCSGLIRWWHCVGVCGCVGVFARMSRCS